MSSNEELCHGGTTADGRGVREDSVGGNRFMPADDIEGREWGLECVAYDGSRETSLGILSGGTENLLQSLLGLVEKGGSQSFILLLGDTAFQLEFISTRWLSSSR